LVVCACGVAADIEGGDIEGAGSDDGERSKTKVQEALARPRGLCATSDHDDDHV
jgi:hypothetical protein